ncbi:MAG: putative ABC transporter ATP-binding protein YxlF [candidate division BRC1 bacterium ADurb.BinA364]|nr:MAG: putative ABC transporter ATP-binding protein YxlF [candidate division BRC1 bacterium ADurb.BinA364]
MPPLLEISRLCVRYGRSEALRGLDACVGGKALGLLGPNGAGKSTLIRALLSLAPIASGTARLAGLDARREGKRIREKVGYMPEHEAFIPGMTVVRFLRFMGEIGGLPPRAAMERAHETLFFAGLGEARYRPMESLSFGMHQKVRLAQAMIHGPEILILDEPTNGLDPAAREEMLALIREIVAASQSRVVVSSHLLRDIESCCEDVLVLRKGRAVASGNIEAMKQTDQNLLEMRVKGNLDRFMAALAELRCECQLSERDLLRVKAPAGFATSEIFAAARRLNAQVRHFYARRDSLEDVFLKVMREEEEAEEHERARPGADERRSD